MVRRISTLLGGALLATLLCSSSTPASAAVHFRYVGGRWSHYRHSGWHRYWGGPSIGFYYSPAPVYVVPGYDDYSYYSGPDYWYSNPSFGLSLNLGGGGGYRREWHGGRTHYREGGYRSHSFGHYRGYRR